MEGAEAASRQITSSELLLARLRPTQIEGASRKLTSFRPVTSRLAARIFRNTLVGSAERSVEISPGVSRSVRPPVTLPGELDRIRSHHVESSPAGNMELLRELKFDQGPTRMHLLRDVMIADGVVLAPRSYERIAKGPRKWFLREKFEAIGESALCSTYLTQKYFGHWLREGMTQELLAEDQGVPALVVNGPERIHEAQYRQLLSLHARSTTFAHCDRLWLLEDWYQNTHWLARYERLRACIRKATKVEHRGDARVFLARGGHAQGRGLANRVEVRSALRDRGWIILEPERETAEVIAKTLASARMVVSPEGSAVGHAAIAMAPGSGILTIIGAQHFNIPYLGLCDALGIRFGFTVADAIDASDFRQPVDRLLRTIDLMDQAIDKN